MKKQKMSYSTKVRMIAGGAYMVLAIYQMLTLNSVLGSGTFLLVGLPVAAFLEMILMLLAAAISVWLFSTRRPISKELKRGFVFATIFWIIYELMSYSAQAQLVSASLGKYLPIISDNALLQYLLIAVRLIIMVFAAFCVLDEGIEEEEEELVSAKTAPTIVLGKQKDDAKAQAKEEMTKKEPEEAPKQKTEAVDAKTTKTATKTSTKSGTKTRKTPPKSGTAKKSTAAKATKE